MPLSAGDKLGRYKILEIIGAGGMGEVYKAADTRLGRTVAIKTLNAEHSARFEREARAIAALNHPNICQIYDVGPNYFVMEFIEGNTLHCPIPLNQVESYALQICDALNAAHNKNITHRDLKPANILVTTSGLKLLDFGLAKIALGQIGAAVGTSGPAGLDAATQAMRLTESGTILGTAAYMSPEQAKGEEADARSDIFSFGVLLYEMLSGRQAFSKSTAIETMAAIVRDDPPPLTAPPKLSAIVTRCLCKLPAGRFQTMNEVRTALEQAAIQEITGPGGDVKSIAVLPFANLSADKENEYFSDGLAEEILNLLTRIPGLKVIARTSSFAFRGKEEDIRKIAKTLGVSNVLEGSVRRAGNRLRITAQLIQATDGTHLWSERFDRDMNDVFAIQDEVGQAISQALQVQLAPRVRAVNIEAYQYYLKGVYHIARITPDSLAKAKECFEQTLMIDPAYAAAYSGLAEYHYVLSVAGMKPAVEMAPLVKSAAQKALEIDSAQSDAHCLLASLAANFDYDWKEAKRHFRQAIASEAVRPMVRWRYVGNYLIPLGRVDDAIEQSRLALEIDPISMTLHLGMAYSLYRANEYLETIEYARKALEIDGNFYFLWAAIGAAQLDLGLTQEAIHSLEHAATLAPWYNLGLGLLAAAYCKAGELERSQVLAQKLAAWKGKSFGAAVYYAAAGQVDAMFETLNLAYQQRDHDLHKAAFASLFDPYRTEPRFQTLLQRMNLA